MKEYKDTIDYLSKEADKKNQQNEAITAENKTLRADRASKAITLSRCKEAIRNARDQMRIVKMKKEENNRNIEKMEKKHEKETKIRDERLRRAEIDSKAQEKSIADLEKQINELKNEMNMNIRNETATTNSNKKTVNMNMSMNMNMNMNKEQ